MTATLDSIITEIYVSGSWLDISSFVVGDVDADWGILGNSPSAKLASIGGLQLTLNNTGNQFSPNHVNMITGWKRGIQLRMKFVFQSATHIKFKGRIETIGLPYTIDGLTVVPVVVNDWLKIASDYPFSLEGVQTNKKADEAVLAVVNALPIAPDATALSVGTEILPTVFSSSSSSGTAYSELSKLALTEFSFTYLKKDRTYGETLVFENRNSRINRTLSGIPDSSVFKLSDDSYLLLSTGERLLLSETKAVNMDYMKSFNADYGENLINKVVIRTNPNRVDTSLQVLYSLNEPIRILAGQTLKDLVIYYKNPTNTTENVNGTNMQTPVASTDYKMFVNANGTGTDLTASLSFTATYGSGGAIYSNIKNNSATDAYITKLQARGYGIYFEGTIDTTIIDSASTNELGVKELFINQQYQNLVYVSEGIAQSLLDQNGQDKIKINNVTFLANLNDDAMNSFLYLDVGDLINLTIGEYSIDSQHYIQSVRYKVRQGGIIEVTWGLIESLSSGITYWELETVGFGELESTTYISL